MRRLCLPLVLVLATLFVSAPAHAAPPGARAGEIIVALRPGTALSSSATASGSGAVELAAALRRAGATTARELGAGSAAYQITVNRGADIARLSATLSALPVVRYAEANHERKLLRTPNDPVLRQQWALRNIQAPEAWDITTGTAIVIAILDTGVSSDHPDLKGKVLAGYDFHNNDGDASDDEGHGTYVAGVAAAYGDNNEGIAGVCWGCQILPVKVLGSNGSGSDAAVAAGMRYAVDRGARIISMSLGGDEDAQVIRDAAVYARARNVLLVAASGNGQANGNRPNYPGAYPETLAVSATDGSDIVTGFSTTGDFVDISAPGVGVWSTGFVDGRNTYEAQNGTSAACPHVAGVAGLVMSIRPDISASDLFDLLIRATDDRGAPGKDPANGYGRLNALRAVQFAQLPDLGRSLVPSPVGAAPAPEAKGGAGAFSRAEPAAGARYFGETGHNLNGAFRSFWERNGGLPIFGFPLSEELVENSYTVQYFERFRLEFHPENAAPFDVLLGRMGADALAGQGRNWQVEFPRGAAQPGCRFFAETGQNVCEPILRAWRASGVELDGRRGTSEAESTALFGLPLSGLIAETLADGKTYQVQYFERARFEIHPENQPPFAVLSGLLGAELTRGR